MSKTVTFLFVHERNNTEHKWKMMSDSKNLFIKYTFWLRVKMDGLFGINFGVDIFGNYSWRNVVGIFLRTNRLRFYD